MENSQLKTPGDPVKGSHYNSTQFISRILKRFPQ